MSQHVECHRCGYGWDYTGNSEYYASCPKCKTSVPLVEDDETRTASASDAGDDTGGYDEERVQELRGRVSELEETASQLQGAIEEMTQKVTEMEHRKHRARVDEDPLHGTEDVAADRADAEADVHEDLQVAMDPADLEGDAEWNDGRGETAPAGEDPGVEAEPTATGASTSESASTGPGGGTGGQGGRSRTAQPGDQADGGPRDDAVEGPHAGNGASTEPRSDGSATAPHADAGSDDPQTTPSFEDVPGRGDTAATSDGADDGPTERREDGPTSEEDQAATRSGVSGAASSSTGVKPTVDDEGSYDYACPECDGPISGEPEMCIHCGTSFRWT